LMANRASQPCATHRGGRHDERHDTLCSKICKAIAGPTRRQAASSGRCTMGWSRLLVLAAPSRGCFPKPGWAASGRMSSPPGALDDGHP
jgi:hypothetical protein